jgi:hypothetical protein
MSQPLTNEYVIDDENFDTFDDEIEVTKKPVARPLTREEQRKALRKKRQALKDQRLGKSVPLNIQNNSQVRSMIKSMAPEASADDINTAFNDPMVRNQLQLVTKMKTARK